MKHLKFVVTVFMTCSVLGNYGIAAGVEVVQTVKLDAEKLFTGEQKSNFVQFSWTSPDNKSAIIYLQKLQLAKVSPNSVTNMTLTIPGEVDGKQVVVEPKAFSQLVSNRIRLHLVFKQKNGRKVKLPKDSSYMFQNSSAIYGIRFCDIDTSNALEMNGMFEQCRNIRTLDLSEFSTQNLKKFKKTSGTSRMFLACPNLKRVNISSFTEEQKEDYALFTMFNDIYDYGGNNYDGWLANRKMGVHIITDAKSSDKPLGKRQANEYDLDSDDCSDFCKDSLESTSAISSPNIEKPLEGSQFSRIHKYCESNKVEDVEILELDVLKPFEMDVKPVTKQIAEPVILPRQTKEGGTFTKHGFVPKIKMPVKKVTYGYVTKEHKQKLQTLPQPEKAMFMRTYVVRDVVVKKPNIGIERGGVSKARKYQQANSIKNVEKIGGITTQAKEEMRLDLKQESNAVQHNTLSIMPEDKRSNNTWYSCIISTIKRIYTKICEWFC